MKILFAGYAERTQVHPMVPLAWAARCSGHDVLVATQPELVEVVADSGLPVTSVGRGLPLYRLWRHADVSGGADPDPALVDPGRELDPATASHAYAELVEWWFRTANEPMLDDLVALCRQWRPDLVVWETVTFAGAIAARATGVPHLRFVWSVDVLASMRERVLAARAASGDDDGVDPLAAWLTRCAARVGTDFSPELAVGRATVTFLPPALRADDPAGLRYLPLRFVPYAGPAVLPSWLCELGPGRRACLTLGTSALGRFERLVVPAREVVRGLAAAGGEVVVTLDDPVAAGMTAGEVPPGVSFVGEVPLEALLEHCDLVVHHGGPGTAATAVVAGLPQLVIAEEFDAPVLARRLAATGAAVDLPLGEATAERVRRAARGIRQDPAYADAAAALRREALAMPSPREVVQVLEDEATTSATSMRSES